jgi:hypothetical protein
LAKHSVTTTFVCPRAPHDILRTYKVVVVGQLVTVVAAIEVMVVVEITTAVTVGVVVTVVVVVPDLAGVTVLFPGQ